VVAGPGAGKTKVITDRVKYVLTNISGNFRVLALTFTNKAANEMKDRLYEIPDLEKRAFVGTIHSFCSSILKNRGEPVGLGDDLHILNTIEDRKKVLIESLNLDPELKNTLKSTLSDQNQEKLLSKWLEAISQFKRDLILPEMVKEETDRRIYEIYDSTMRASNLFDFDDLLLKTYTLFVSNPSIPEFYRRLYKYICIDEAQDLNRAQYEIIRLMCESNHNNVLMVGDPNQSIFGFVGANKKYMDLFEKDFDARKIHLDENFRSAKAITTAARKIIPDVDINENLPVNGVVSLIVGNDEKEEAELVLKKLKEFVNNADSTEDKLTWNSCALIGRNRYVLYPIESELISNGIPYYKQESIKQLSESDLMKEFELGLEILSNPQDLLHLKALLSRWNSSVDPRDLVDSGIQGQEVIKRLKNLSVTKNDVVLEALSKVSTGPNKFSLNESLVFLKNSTAGIRDTEERELLIKDITEWNTLWNYYLRNQNLIERSPAKFLNFTSERSIKKEDNNGLALLTVHSAKGLEFELVVVMGMVEGVFPDYRAHGKDLDEEKRNAFVSITRSKRFLFLSYPKTRLMPWGEIFKVKPSRFLFDIGLLP
jgi:DNA helicase-2/ATP-dependent DNA helicase PcrA